MLAGDDTITFPLMTMGVDGVISVIGNAFPREFGRMVHLIEEKQYDKALRIHHFFKELFTLLFVDGNPAGVKCAMAELGLLDENLRLPLVEMQSPHREAMKRLIKALQSSDFLRECTIE